MNTVLLNTVNLDDSRIIKKGDSGGGGNTPGGGGGSDIPVIGDGKTYLYIKIAEKGRMNVPLYFSQTVANGVTIDWGDGSATQTLSGTGNKNTTHTYKDVGEYVISLNPADGCTLTLGSGFSSNCVLGSTSGAYCNMLQAVEIGKNVKRLGSHSFSHCFSLSRIIIPEGVNSYEIINSTKNEDSNTFFNCTSLSSITIPQSFTQLSADLFNGFYSLTSIVIPNSVTSIGEYAFSYCQSLVNLVIPDSVTSIKNYAFRNCTGMAFYDFSQCTSVPTLGGTSVFNNIQSDCKIVVPDALYDEWKAATNWSSHASKIVKASEFNA